MPPVCLTTSYHKAFQKAIPIAGIYNNRSKTSICLPWVKSVFSVFKGNSPFRHDRIELLDGVGHPGAGNVQRIADVGHLHPDALPLQALAVSFRVLIFQPQYSTFVRFCQITTERSPGPPPKAAPLLLSSGFYRSIYPVRGICFYFCIIWYPLVPNDTKWYHWYPLAAAGCRRYPAVSLPRRSRAEKSRGPEASAF